MRERCEFINIHLTKFMYTYCILYREQHEVLPLGTLSYEETNTDNPSAVR